MTAKKPTAAEYDAMVNARIFGGVSGKRTSSTTRYSDSASSGAEPSTPRRTTSSSKKKRSISSGANGTPKRTASSSKKKAAIVRTPSTSGKKKSTVKSTSSASSSSSSAVQSSSLNTRTSSSSSASRRVSNGTDDVEIDGVIVHSAVATHGSRGARSTSLQPSQLDVAHIAHPDSAWPPQSPETDEEDLFGDHVTVKGPIGYLSQRGLKTLKEYKYVSGFTGATDKYVMIPLWNWSLQFVPIWMAPNLLTTMSLSCGIASYFLFQYHSPDFDTAPPSWVFYLTSVLMFAYLILDGLDGKQARRTGSSSPLGQLFDHGCDAICCFLCGIFISTTVQLGSHRSLAVVLFLHIVPFFASNWEEYCTGVMRFGVIGITEGQLFICLLLALTGAIGVDAWDARIPIPSSVVQYLPHILKPSFSEPMECKFILIFIGCCGVCYQLFSSAMSVRAYNLIHQEERVTQKIYNKAKRILAHFLTFIALGACWVFSPSKFFNLHPRIVLLTIGMLFGYQVSRLIISRVTKDPYPFGFLNMLFVPYLVLIVNCFMNEPLPTWPLAVSYLAMIFLVYGHFIVMSINQICDFLEIRCFNITWKEEKGKNKKVQ